MNLTLSEEQIAILESLQNPCDPPGMVTAALGRVAELGLCRGDDRYWCLDVRSGVPYFAWVAAKYDHNVICVREPSDLITEAAAVLGCELVSHVMSRDSFLPSLPHRFDLITIFGGIPHAFAERDYGRLVQEAFVHWLNPGGRICTTPDCDRFRAVWQKVEWWHRFIPAKMALIEKRHDWIDIHSK